MLIAKRIEKPYLGLIKVLIQNKLIIIYKKIIIIQIWLKNL